jgi:pimeloyl-ACP methyl ester carboxylesterase
MKTQLLNDTIPALTFGDPEKPIILALHGWLDNAASYAQLAPLLTDYYVVAIDLPGHGLAPHEATDDTYSIDDYENWVNTAIESITDQPIILLGHSMGGAIACLFAAKYPEKVSKLICIDALGPLSQDALDANPTLQESAKRMREAVQFASTKTYESLEKMIQARVRANNLTPDELELMVRRGVTQTPDGWQWRFDPALTNISRYYYAEKTVLEGLSKLSMPVLVVEGSDGIFHGQAHYQTRFQAVPHLTHVVITGNHHVHMHQAQAVADAIKNFLLK